MNFQTTAVDEMNRMATDIIECPNEDCRSENIDVDPISSDQFSFRCGDCGEVFEVPA